MNKIVLAALISSLVACGGSGGGSEGSSASEPLVPQNAAPTASDVTILYGKDKILLTEVTSPAWAGELLTGNYVYSDTEADAQDNNQTRYRWLVGGTEVSTGLAYQSQRSDAGKEIVFEVTPVAAVGEATGPSQSSAAAKLIPRQQIFFLADGPSSNITGDNSAIFTSQLFITDGNHSQTISLAELNGELSKPIALPTAQTGLATEKWLFVVDKKLWVTNGRSEGTHALQIEKNGSLVDVVESARYLTAFNGYIYFQGDDIASGQNKEIWRTDGTAAGTQLVVDLLPQGTSNVAELTVMGEHLYFVASFKLNGIYSGKEMYRLAKDHSYELVKDINPGSLHSNPSVLTAIKDMLYFTARPAAGEYAVYVTDGTDSGTLELVRAADTEGRKPSHFVAVEDTVYFTINNTGADQGDLYLTQGTLESTDAEHINSIPFNASLNPSINALSGFNDLLFFSADRSNSNKTTLVGFKPSTSGYDTTHILDLANNPSMPIALKDRIVFSAESLDSSERQLYTATGSEITSRHMTKLNMGATGVSAPQDLTELNGQVLFAATTDDYGQELWITDGSEDGTKLLKDIRSGTVGSSPFILSDSESNY